MENIDNLGRLGKLGLQFQPSHFLVVCPLVLFEDPSMKNFCITKLEERIAPSACGFRFGCGDQGRGNQCCDNGNHGCCNQGQQCAPPPCAPVHCAPPPCAPPPCAPVHCAPPPCAPPPCAPVHCAPPPCAPPPCAPVHCAPPPCAPVHCCW